MSEFCLVHGYYVGQTVPGCPICKFLPLYIIPIVKKQYIIDKLLTDLWDNEYDDVY